MESGWQRHWEGTQCSWFPLAVAGSGPAATMVSLSEWPQYRSVLFSSTSLGTAKENRCSKWHLALESIAPRGVFQIRVSLVWWVGSRLHLCFKFCKHFLLYLTHFLIGFLIKELSWFGKRELLQKYTFMSLRELIITFCSSAAIFW